MHHMDTDVTPNAAQMINRRRIWGYASLCTLQVIKTSSDATLNAPLSYGCYSTQKCMFTSWSPLWFKKVMCNGSVWAFCIRNDVDTSWGDCCAILIQGIQITVTTKVELGVFTVFTVPSVTLLSVKWMNEKKDITKVMQRFDTGVVIGIPRPAAIIIKQSRSNICLSVTFV